MKKTLEFILDGAAVKRFHTVTVLHEETVGHHSHNVAMMCLLLNPNASRNLLLAAMFHDLAEHKTGDIPSPAKREYNITEQVTSLESELMVKAGIKLPVLTEEEERTLKLADIASGMIYCIQEAQMGNNKMLKILNTYLKYTKQFFLSGREEDLFCHIEELQLEGL
tara:strand:- start:2483 stop:2980 length:498 start_codon:yes stop_codon:yes gene_type:complete